MLRNLSTFIGCVACLALLLLAGRAAAEAVPVELQQADDGWRLVRGGEPYPIKGAGGDSYADGPYLGLLVKAGGNSIRTWGVGDETRAVLDAAHKHGLTVTVGLWLGHERHGFDYTDMDQVAEQLAQVRAAVLEYKDHPAVLAWGVGNEMEGYGAGDNAAIWSHVEACAAMIKHLDPHHPTMTVIAEIGGRKVEAIHKLCPSIDIVGVNSYGGAASLPKRYAEAKGTKPYIVTEFGPPGSWEVGPNAFGAPVELTSSAKAGAYKAAYKAFTDDKGVCLGSYAFLWGNKVEATTTWFGMFLEDGSKLAAVDAMTEAWSGKAPADLCPVIDSLKLGGAYEMRPGAEVSAKLKAGDPEGKPLKVEWSLLAESSVYFTGGDKMDKPPAFPERVTSSGADGCTLTLPDKPGIYRIYAVVKDPAGNAAVANIPLSAGPAKEDGPADGSGVVITPGKPVKLPLVVYTETDAGMPWIPSGYMGNAGAVKLDPEHGVEPRSGKACIKVMYKADDEWAGVVWQDPPNDWGDAAGGYDLTGAAALEFWARGDRGGEVVSFGFGVLGSDKKHPDSGKGELKAVRLTEQWRRYRVELGKGVDMRRIKTGFFWSVEGKGKPIAFYLDDIRYVSEGKD